LDIFNNIIVLTGNDADDAAQRTAAHQNAERPPIYAREATAAGMPHPGVAVRRRPGPRDTAPHHAVSGRALPSEESLSRITLVSRAAISRL